MCNKIKQLSTYNAEKMINSLAGKGKFKKGTVIGTYWCNECNGYHITKKTGPHCIVKTKI